VCRFHKHLQSSPSLLSCSIYLCFITEGNLLLHTSYLPLGVPNGLVKHHAQGQNSRDNLTPSKGAAIFWRRCRGLEEQEAPTSIITSLVNWAPSNAVGGDTDEPNTAELHPLLLLRPPAAAWHRCRAKPGVVGGGRPSSLVRGGLRLL
jgi:hypothetical protein